MAIVDSRGKPVSLLIASATPHEITLVKQVINARFTRWPIRRLTGDKAYDSDRMDHELKALGTELNAPHRSGRKSAPTQDGRKLRQYKQRWKVERYFAWLFNFRKCVVRYEYKEENFFAFLLLASAIIMIR
jgi:transposase